MEFGLLSLKKLCIHFIVIYFDVYYSAFTLSTSAHLQMTLEAVARICSAEVLTGLIEDDKLKEEYLNFLINPYIKELDIEGIEEKLLPALVGRLQAVGENKIVFLRTAFRGVQLDYYERLLRCLEKVEVIEMSKVIHPEVMLEISKRCTLLRELNVWGCVFDDIGIFYLFKNVDGGYENKPHLEKLVLSMTCDSFEAVSFVLRHAPSLKFLNSLHTVKAIYATCINDLKNNLIEGKAKYSLTKLIFPQKLPNAVDAFKICTALCPDVSTITVSYLGNKTLALCAGFAKLKEIIILPYAFNLAPNRSYSFEGVTGFLNLKGKDLSKLFIEHHCVSALAITEHCPNLRSLELLSVQFMRLDGGVIFAEGKLPHLELLGVMNSNFSVKEIQDSFRLLLVNAPNLTKLDTSQSTGLRTTFIDSLLHIGLLKVLELNLRHTDIMFASVIDLLSRGSLKILEIWHCTNISYAQEINLIRRAKIHRVQVMGRYSVFDIYSAYPGCVY